MGISLPHPFYSLLKITAVTKGLLPGLEEKIIAHVHSGPVGCARI